MGFPSLTYEEANQNRAWIINENEKSQASRPTVSKCMRDWSWVSQDGIQDEFKLVCSQ